MNATLEIVNLKCGGCANSIKKGLKSIDGAENITVNLETSEINMEVPDENVLQKVKEKLSKMGYPEIGDANTLVHKAKSFVSCASGRMSSEN
jgi:copper chaperone CopZ